MFLMVKHRPLPTIHAYVSVSEERDRELSVRRRGVCFASQTKVGEGENNANNKIVKHIEILQYSKYQP